MRISLKLVPNNNEATANKYVIHCVHIAMLIIFTIWLLNTLNIFVVNQTIMSYCFALTSITYLIGMICWHIFGINHKAVKYFIILWTMTIMGIMGVGLTYHALPISVLPVLFCSLYSSKKLFVYTTFLTIVSTIIVVFTGYYIGLCDANMVLLTSEPLTGHITSDGLFALTEINKNPLLTLTLFFVIPRCILSTLCLIVCYNITKMIRNSAENAERMKNLAETDSMTGFYNRSKYLDILSNCSKEVNNVSVIFWDINNLKTINDTKGHEAGDLLIRTVANCICSIVDNSDSVFRIGGDEFIMISENAGEKEVLAKIESWNKAINEIQPLYSFEISASLGYAYGKENELKDLINKADQMMYEEKKKHHTSR